MTKIRIVSDSTCDLSLKELEELNVDFVPVSVIVDGVKYKQNINITNEELYHRLIVEKKSISTAAPAPGEFVKVFTQVLKEVDYIIFISVSSNMSVLYQTAKLVAKDYFPEQVYVLDSQTASLAMALLVYEAAMMVKEGKSAEEIITRIENLSNYAHAVPLLDTLEYIYRGGRIKLYQKLLGNFLGVKPLICINHKGSSIDGKVKGRKNALIQMKMFGLQIIDNLKINRFYVAYTTDKSLAEEVVQFLKDNSSKKVEIMIKQLGSVIGVHGGNDVIGYGFVGEYHPDMFNKIGEKVKSSLKNALSTKSKV